MDHKAKCKRMKKFRKFIADKLGVDLHQKECTYEGECSGTCPKCKQEEEILNKALLSKGAVTVAAVATAVSMSGCSPANNPKPHLSSVSQLEYVDGEEIAPPEIEEGDIEILEGDVVAPIDDLVGEVAIPIDDLEGATTEVEPECSTGDNSGGDVIEEGGLELVEPDSDYVDLEGDVLMPVEDSGVVGNVKELLHKITFIS